MIVCVIRERENECYGGMCLVHKLRLYWKGDKSTYKRKRENTAFQKSFEKYYYYFTSRAFNSIFGWFLDKKNLIKMMEIKSL